MVLPIALIVNVYERTYRRALQPGFFDRIGTQNRVGFAERWALVNNVDDREDARVRAQALVDAGELTGFAFVSDVIDEALSTARLPRSVLARRGYFLDFGLAMTAVGTTPFLLGWDAETHLREPYDWLTPAVELLTTRRDIFSASPRWPVHLDTLAREEIGREGDWSLNYGFSDQVFLVRRADVRAPIYRAFAPAALARHYNHHRTFEARIEAWQRAKRLLRATHVVAQYETNDMGDVMTRSGGYSRVEMLERKALSALGRVLRRLPVRSPRLRLP